MKTILALLRKEWTVFVNDRVGMMLTFIVPVVLIIVFGSVFGKASDPSGIRLAVLNLSDSPEMIELVKTLDTMKTFKLITSVQDENDQAVLFTEESIQNFVKKGNAPAALVIPKDAGKGSSLGVTFRFYYDPRNDIEMQLIQGMLQKTIMEKIPQLLTKSLRNSWQTELGGAESKSFESEIALTVNKFFGVDTSLVFKGFMSGGPDSTGSSENMLSELVTFEKKQVVGEEIKNQTMTRNVGGWAMMFLLFTITASSVSLFDEKKLGVIHRLLSAPLSRAHILWSKYIFNILLGIVQLSALFLAGFFLFQIDIFGNFFALFAVIAASATTCTAFGMLLASISKTSAQASGYGMFLILTMSAVGGAWFPTFLMPPFIQFFSRFSIVYWSMDGFIGALWRKASIIELLPQIGVLLAVAAVLILISLFRFRKGNVL